MSRDEHFRLVNPAALAAAGALLATAKEARAGCGNYSDAEVCKNGATDVTCTGEIYAGCYSWEVDCADNPGYPPNLDDRCCAGLHPTNAGDNIDHMFCAMQDADYGGFSWCLYGLDYTWPAE